MVHSIFRWLYCMDISHILLLITAATLLFLYLQNRFSHSTSWKWLLGIALLFWAVAVLYSTVWTRSETPGTVSWVPFHSYRAVANGGNSEIYRSNFMNVLLFYPAGLIATAALPAKWPGWLRCVLVFFALAAMSAGIEWAQYRFALGNCEIDDVIHNAFGAMLGALVVHLRQRFSK